MITKQMISYKRIYTNENLKSAFNCRLFYFSKYSIIAFAASLPERAAQATVPLQPAISPPAKILGFEVLFFHLYVYIPIYLILTLSHLQMILA